MKDLLGKLLLQQNINKKNFVAILICLGIALLFWFLVALSNKYSSTINLPVRYEKLPYNKILINELPEEINIKINTYGYNIFLDQIISRLKPLTINVESNLIYFSKGGFIKTDWLVNNILLKLSEDVHVIDIFPDSIYFIFSEKIEKKVPINLDMDISFNSQYDISGMINIEPDSVTISGQKLLLDTIEEWKTQRLLFHDIHGNIKTDVPLLEPIDMYIKVDPNKATLTIPVEVFTQADIDAEVILNNVPDGMNIQIYPKKINIVFQTPLSMYESIKSDMFDVKADFLHIDLENARSVKLTLSKHPLYMKNIKLMPDEVVYIIQN